MKNTWKCIIALILAAAMSLSLISVNVWAAEVLPQEAEASVEEVETLADESQSAQSSEGDTPATEDPEDKPGDTSEGAPAEDGTPEGLEDESAAEEEEQSEAEPEPEPEPEPEEVALREEQEGQSAPENEAESAEESSQQAPEAGDASEYPEEGEVRTEERFFDPFAWEKNGKPERKDGEEKLTPQSMPGYNPRSGYGGELSAAQRRIYEALVSSYIGEDGLSNGITKPATINTPDSIIKGSTTDELFQDLDYAFWAFVYDYPELFWAGGVSISISYVVNSGTYILNSATFSILEKYSGAIKVIAAYNEGVRATADQIYGSVTTGQAYDLYLAIHDWMCDHMSYNDEAIEDPDEYAWAYSSGPVFAGTARVTCQGYGETFKVLCDQVRIRNHLDELYCADIIGYSHTGESHMWNYVWIDDLWYAVDTLWDDQKIRVYTYFLCGSNSQGFQKTFREEHIESNNFTTDGTVQFNYPVIETEKYKVKYLPSVDGWGFGNYSVPFISEQLFFRVYDHSKLYNRHLYGLKKGAAAHGICQGLALSSALSYIGQPSLSVWQHPSANHASDFHSTDLDTRRSQAMNLSLNEYIQSLFLFQYSKEAATQERDNKNHFDEIIQRTKTFYSTGHNPIAVIIKRGVPQLLEGHVLIPYRVVSGERTIKLYVYDCNCISLNEQPDEQYIELQLDDKGKIVGWSYELWPGLIWGSSRPGAYISYYDNFHIINSVLETNDVIGGDNNLFCSNADKFTYTTKDGKTETVENGVIIGENLNGLVPIYGSSAAPDGNTDEEAWHLFYTDDADAITVQNDSSHAVTSVFAGSKDGVTVESDGTSSISLSTDENRIDMRIHPGNSGNVSFTYEAGYENRVTVETNTEHELTLSVDKDRQLLLLEGCSGQTDIHTKSEDDTDDRTYNGDHSIAIDISDVTKETILDFGTTDGLNWCLSLDGVLTISGKGPLTGDSIPWSGYADQIESLVLEPGITSVNRTALQGLTNLKKLSIPATVDSLPAGLLSGCTALEELELPFVGTARDAVDENAVLGALFEQVSSGGVLQYYKRSGTSLSGRRYKIPTTLRKVSITDASRISFGAFCGCSMLEEVNLNEGIESLAMYSFQDCSGLKSLTIPTSVQSVEEEALGGCNALTSLTLPFVGGSREANGTAEAVLGHAFGRRNQQESNYYVQYYALEGASLSGYGYAVPDSLREVILTDSKTLPVGAFSGLNQLESVTLPACLEAIGSYAFFQASRLKEIHYLGTKESWRQVQMGENNSLEGVSIQYQNGNSEESCSHQWNEGVVTTPATCKSEGVKTFTCSVCDEKKTEPIAKNAKNHAGGTEIRNRKAATCGAAGYTGDTYCLGCGELLEEGEEIPATGKHSWDNGSVTTPATCKLEGVKTFTCSVCGEKKTEPIAKNANNHVGGTEIRNRKAATCGAEGYTGDTYCKGCSKKLSSGEKISATGKHSWDNGSVTTPATTTTEGVKTYTCKVCKQKKTERIEKLSKAANTIAGAAAFTKTANANKDQTFDLGASANGAVLTYNSGNKNVSVNKGKVTIKKGFVGKAAITISAAETDQYLAAKKQVNVTVNLSVTQFFGVKWDAKKKAANISWKKNTSGKGYEVQVSLQKNFKKVAKKVVIKTNATVKTDIKGLKKGTYFVRMRTVNGKNYSAWSKVKTLNIAK